MKIKKLRRGKPIRGGLGIKGVDNHHEIGEVVLHAGGILTSIIDGYNMCKIPGQCWHKEDMLMIVRIKDVYKIKGFNPNESPTWNSSMDGTIGKVGCVIQKYLLNGHVNYEVRFSNTVSWHYLGKWFEKVE